jgi:hypothetical protein
MAYGSASRRPVGKTPGLRHNPFMDLLALGSISLAGADGAEHRLGDLWRERSVVLVFLRHFG